jgi:hypothetical protein
VKPPKKPERISTFPPGADPDLFDESGAVKDGTGGKTPEISKQIEMQDSPDREAEVE